MVLFLWVVACQDAEPIEDEARGDCNPVSDAHCMLPFPSDFFMEPDDSTPSGQRLSFGESSLPVNVDGVALDPMYLHELDGFSTNSSLYVDLSTATLEGVISHQDLGAYLNGDARTVIINSLTGERVPHFVEREAAAGEGRSLLMLRPAQQLDHTTQYVVGIQGLVDASGALVAAPAGFEQLRDGDSLSDSDLSRQVSLYEETIFPVLADAGLVRDQLQLAWSFSTVSEESSLGRMAWLRDDALATMGMGGPEFTVTEIEPGNCDSGGNVGQTLHGSMVVPLYLTEDIPGSILTRGEDGYPFNNGETEAEFTVVVPCSLLSDPRPGMLVQYGHGLLGHRSEVESGYLSELANENGWVLFAVSWTGMKSIDAPAITLALINEPHMFITVPERTMQGYVEALAAGRMMTGDFATSDYMMVDGESIVDTTSLYFYGNSQGAVLGGGYVAMSPDIDRAVLGVPGMPFTLLLTRAVGFAPFLQILETMYEDWADISLLMSLFQPLWDPAEAGGWGHQMDVPVLMQAAIGDGSVPTLGAHVMARTYGAALVQPAARPVWGIEEAEYPHTGSAIVEFDYGITEPLESVPAESNIGDPHDWPRTSSLGQRQIATFLETGVVEQTCDGACDPD